MRCLSLWQPWASVIFELDHLGQQIKRDETRHWPTGIRGPLAIHAAKTKAGRDDIPEEWLAPLGLAWDTMPYGCIIGTVELIACHKTEIIRPQRTDVNLEWGNYAPGRFAFELARPIKFAEPIPYRGQQGFFEVEL